MAAFQEAIARTPLRDAVFAPDVVAAASSKKVLTTRWVEGRAECRGGGVAVGRGGQTWSPGGRRGAGRCPGRSIGGSRPHTGVAQCCVLPRPSLGRGITGPWGRGSDWS